MNRRFPAAPAAALLLLSFPLLFSQSAVAQAAPPPGGPGMSQDGPGGPGGPDGMHDGMHHFPMHHEHGGRDGGPGMRDHGDHPEFDLLPPGTWWRIPDLATRIGLSKDQVTHMDNIFLDARSQLIQEHATLEEEELRLEPLLRANPIDQSATLAQISKIADTRAGLEKANAKMLLDIRAVLTADQWTKLRTPPDHWPGHGPAGMHGMHGQPGGMQGEAPATPPAQ